MKSLHDAWYGMSFNNILEVIFKGSAIFLIKIMRHQ